MSKTIDWSKAPSDATHAGIKSGDVKVWYKDINASRGCYLFKAHDMDDWSKNLGSPAYLVVIRPATVDLTKLDTPFGELDRATQLRLVEHVLDGGVFNDEQCIQFDFETIYRAVAKQPTELEQLESQSASLLEQMTQLDNKIKTLKGGAK